MFSHWVFKSAEKRQIWSTPSWSWPVYGFQPSLKSSLKHSFLNVFKCFFLYFKQNLPKTFEMNKKGWKWPKKVFQPAFRCAQHPKTGLNTQQWTNP